MTHDPKEVIEAMARSHYLIPAAYDGLPEHEKAGIRSIVRAPLRAALAMGWKMVPMEMTDEMRDDYFDGNPVWADYKWGRMVDAAPDLVGE